MRHELGYLGWVLLCDPRHEYGELTALEAAGFPINGVWRPAVPGPNSSDGQRGAWLEASVTKHYAWRYMMAACMVWRTLFVTRIQRARRPYCERAELGRR